MVVIFMKGEVLHIHRNIRYRLISINDTRYIVDLDYPLLVFFFPFLNWMKSHVVYKIIDENQLEQLKVIKSTDTKVGYTLLTGGLSVLGANLLEMVMDKFEISMPNVINYIILFTFTILIVFCRFHISRRNKRKLYDIVQLEKLEKIKIRFGPQNVKHFFLFLILYLGFLASSLAGIIMFIQYKNFLILFFTILFLFCFLFVNGISLFPGKNKIRMKELQNFEAAK